MNISNIISNPYFADDNVNLIRVVVGPIDNNVFILQCKKTQESILIDAASEHQLLLQLCKELNVKTIIETHGHWDHIGAIEQLREEGYQVGVTQQDSSMLSSYDYLLNDNIVIEIGNLKIKTIATPGHTPGSMCFYLEESPLLFTGDTLFAGGPGATHFPGGDFDTIINSINTRLFQVFPDETIVLPGHGRNTTIGIEKPNLDRWIALYK